MSTFTLVCGSASKSTQLRRQELCHGHRLKSSNSTRSVCGVGPADSTGKSLVRCWPGGMRSVRACGLGNRARLGVVGSWRSFSSVASEFEAKEPNRCRGFLSKTGRILIEQDARLAKRIGRGDNSLRLHKNDWAIGGQYLGRDHLGVERRSEVVYRRPVGIIVDIKALRLEGLVSVESIDVTDVGIERLQQLFPDEDFDS